MDFQQQPVVSQAVLDSMRLAYIGSPGEPGGFSGSTRHHVQQPQQSPWEESAPHAPAEPYSIYSTRPAWTDDNMHVGMPRSDNRASEHALSRVQSHSGFHGGVVVTPAVVAAAKRGFVPIGALPIEAEVPPGAPLLPPPAMPTSNFYQQPQQQWQQMQQQQAQQPWQQQQPSTGYHEPQQQPQQPQQQQQSAPAVSAAHQLPPLPAFPTPQDFQYDAALPLISRTAGAAPAPQHAWSDAAAAARMAVAVSPAAAGVSSSGPAAASATWPPRMQSVAGGGTRRAISGDRLQARKVQNLRPPCNPHKL